MPVNNRPKNRYEFANKANLIAVVSDRSRVLGLGSIGQLAGLQVMRLARHSRFLPRARPDYETADSRKSFTAVAAEADWPDAYRVNRYVQGQSMDADNREALSGFRRSPTWMWRNADILDFVGGLRMQRKARFYRPESERTSHYFHARLADQFQAVIHIDETRAVGSLEMTSEWGPGEPAKTYPTGE
ncbi:MAG TPA: erythromycin esterase family protein [Bryobacteraceae bacterium]|nr:erythromycin esterase family protein [Bryobacteraceae bacterium]